MKNEVKKRYEWVKLYEAIGNTGGVYLRCGITRPTRRKWVKRFKESSIDGLSDHSIRPHKIYHKIQRDFKLVSGEV